MRQPFGKKTAKSYLVFIPIPKRIHLLFTRTSVICRVKCLRILVKNPVITVAGNSAARSSEYEIYMDDEKQGSLKSETSSGKLRMNGDMNGKPVIIKGR